MSGVRVLALSLVLVAAGSLSPAADIDWGVTLDDQTTYGDRPSTTPDAWEQRAKAAVWVAVDFTDRLTLDAQVSYLNTNEPLNQVDVDVLKLSGSTVLSGTGLVSWVAGRQRMSDPTGLVLSHQADGVSVTPVRCRPAWRKVAVSWSTSLLRARQVTTSRRSPLCLGLAPLAFFCSGLSCCPG